MASKQLPLSAVLNELVSKHEVQKSGFFVQSALCSMKNSNPILKTIKPKFKLPLYWIILLAKLFWNVKQKASFW